MRSGGGGPRADVGARGLPRRAVVLPPDARIVDGEHRDVAGEIDVVSIVRVGAAVQLVPLGLAQLRPRAHNPGRRVPVVVPPGIAQRRARRPFRVAGSQDLGKVGRAGGRRVRHGEKCCSRCVAQ